MDEFALGMVVGIVFAVAIGVFVEPWHVRGVLNGTKGEKKPE